LPLCPRTLVEQLSEFALDTVAKNLQRVLLNVAVGVNNKARWWRRSDQVKEHKNSRNYL